MQETLKSWVEHIPPAVGKPLANIPYSLRLGSAYNRSKRDIAWFQMHSIDEMKAEIAERVRQTVQSAQENTVFYRRLYAKCDIRADDIRSLDDVTRLPIVTKADLGACDLTSRSIEAHGRMRINTGGTSGEPLHFFVDRNVFAREWGHMHFIWKKLGYRRTDIKLTFRGKNLGKEPLRYNAVHNEYMANAYCPHARIIDAVRQVAGTIRFIHGYPSSIYEFVRRCRESATDVLRTLRANLKGILLASEYPAPVYRQLISEELGAPSLSWYGHSEMTILAYENEPYVYVPLHSYGFCEAVGGSDGMYRLVGTSYYNNVSPFIRYDTGDLVTPEFEEGLLRSFRIAEGRIGDFVTDASGTRISLTALIFGRHHRVFEDAKFVQICQSKPGEATLLVTVNSGRNLSEAELGARFDLSNIDIAFSLRVLPEPIRSETGKVPLRVDAKLVKES